VKTSPQGKFPLVRQGKKPAWRANLSFGIQNASGKTTRAEQQAAMVKKFLSFSS